jgi:flagellar assembly protein FliH
MTSKIIKGRPVPLTSLFEREETLPKVIDQEVLVAHERARSILREAEQDAERCCEEARQRAAAILREAMEEGERLRAQAAARGGAEGLARWESLILEHGETMRQALDEAQPQLVQLAVRVAEKILRQRLQSDPDAIVPMLQEALGTVRSYRGSHLLLHLHPDDIPLVQRAQRRLQAHDARWSTVELVAQEGMTRGGCRIETDFGTIEASVETQLGAIRKLLLDRGEVEP